MPLSRRGLLLGGGALLTTGAAAFVVIGGGGSDAATLTVAEAYQRAQSGEILLIDIRRPEEWAATGIPAGAVAIDMRRDDFTETLAAARGESAAPVALICARGVRSRRLTNRLNDAGIGPVIDVPGGMLGSFAGPGWLAAELPVAQFTE